MIDLILQYKKAKKSMERDKAKMDDPLKIEIANQIIADMDYAIRWMKTGEQPDAYSRAVESKSAYSRRALLDLEIFPCLDITPTADRIISDNRKRAVMQVIQHLTERQLTCFLLHTAHMRSMQEIADELGIAKSTVQEHLDNAEKKIKNIAVNIQLEA
ncbi:helix-turn-helix domain-containing protein [Lysinibacillus sp. CD3-6]|uniref:sigma factor-like helix-turn-helix DNA-binding protein n=1 Tax=Lysinibacillus sp. CD3-6 TaxID=2892541 RepID=UPI001D175871|nr:sigma factor-like helix-turn-helix DNA-binding protein [Lysinibacillus sp. CD3-6]UED81940.1 helix-turn-helix domain-containing protein [Lysinibacillus sp. CD3-6]